MNIQKTDLVLLNKIRFAGENAPQAPVPETTEKSAEAGMKALSFQGMKNLMGNPALAQKVGIEGDEEAAEKNPAFKGGKQKMATAALVLASLIGTGALTSCKNEGDEYTQIAEQSVTVDQTQTAILQALLEEIQAMRQDMKDRDAAYQQKFDQVINLIFDLYTISQKEAVDNATFREKVITNQDAIIFLVEQQGIKSDKANELLNNILNSNLSIEAQTAAIKSLVTDIKSMIAKGL